MPFLAAVLGDRWDGRWAGYAYMISIELYAASAASPLGEGGYYFRMYYDGRILTLPGCDAELCDVTVLLDALAYGQEYMPCSVDTPEPNAVPDDGCDDDDDSLGTTHWILITLLTFLLGGLLGAGMVVFVDRQRKLRRAANASPTSTTHPLHDNM